MKPYIEKRVLDIAEYITEKETTIRDTAKKFGISKSTVHKDLRDRLPKLNMNLYREVDAILNINLSERHIRGGMATRERYKQEERKIG